MESGEGAALRQAAARLRNTERVFAGTAVGSEQKGSFSKCFFSVYKLFFNDDVGSFVFQWKK